MKNLRYMMFSALAAIAMLSVGCVAESGPDIEDPDSEQEPETQDNGFLKSQQECIGLRHGIYEDWCHQNVDEKSTAYFCVREPPELLRAVTLDGRPNMFCGCDPGYGYEQCPYNINRDRQ
jgi:hypothetical protein